MTRKSFLKSGAGALGSVIFDPGVALSATRRQIHVAPHGDDSQAGTAAKPLRTLAAARNAARRAAPATVIVGDGIYEESLLLTAEDAGSQWIAAPGARPYLTNSRRLSASDFRPVADAPTRARIAPEVVDRIVALDLKAKGLRNINSYADRFYDNGGIVELFADRARMPIARYPNQGNMSMKSVVVNGGGQEQSGDWRSYYQPGGVSKQAKPRPGVFVYRDDRTRRWMSALPKGVWLKGYWRVPWQNEAVRVAAIDPTARTITLATPVPGGIGNKYARPAGDGREQYYLINLLEELDQPGEWCIDFSTATLYYYPPRPLHQINLRIADENRPVITLQDTSGVLIAGLSVGECLGDGVLVTGGRDNRIAGCKVSNVTRYGVRLQGGVGHEALSNDVHDTGAGGIWLGGGDETAQPRKPARHRVVNNHIWNFGVIEKVYAPGVNCGFTGGGGGGHHAAVGMTVANNLIHDGPHAGILHGSWDNIFENNEIFRYCSVSNDMGAIYCFDRYERSGKRVIRNNFFHNSPIGDGVFFDADNREDLIERNIAWKIGHIAFLMKGAVNPANPLLLHVVDNIAVDCGSGYSLAARRGSKIERNLAVNCKRAFSWASGKGGSGPEGDVASGVNGVYASDPGFVDARKQDFSLRPDGRAAKEVGTRGGALAKVGLFVDAYRRSLPDPATLRRWEDPDPALRVSYAIRDRA